MPFKSAAQARAIFAKDKGMGKEFAAHTPNMASLPPRVGAPGMKPPMAAGMGGAQPLANLMRRPRGLMPR